MNYFITRAISQPWDLRWKEKKLPCAWASSSAGQVSLSKHWVNALADPKPTQGDSQLLHAGFARDEWGRTSPSPPTAVSPHQQHPSAWGQPPSSIFFFFSTLFFFHYTEVLGQLLCWCGPLPQFYMHIGADVRSVSGEACCKRLYDGGTQSSPAGGISTDTSRRPTCTCPSRSAWLYG